MNKLCFKNYDRKVIINDTRCAQCEMTINEALEQGIKFFKTKWHGVVCETCYDDIREREVGHAD